jgi:3-dehydroquinate synthase
MRAAHAGAGRCEDQRSFEVRYDYSVYFTRDGLIRNPCLMTALARRGTDERHRVAVFVDDGVTLAYPTLEERIVRYAERHAGSMQIVDSVVVMPGGEVIKHPRDCVEQISYLSANHTWGH